METMILNTNNLRTDAVLLAAGSDRMRVVLRNGNDTIELQREGGQWISEDGSAFELEAWIVDSCPGSQKPCGELPWRVDGALRAWLHQANLINTGSGNLSA
jgi:hypothetical protein